MLQSKIERKSSENALWALPDFVVATLTSTQTLKAIATAFPLLSEFAEDCHSESEPIMKYSFGYNKIAEKGTSVQEKFLLFSLAVRRLLSEVSVCPEEQGQIISFASARFEQSLHSENGTPVQKMVELYPPRIRILLRLLILSTVHITPVSSALHSLERILEDLASSTGKMAFLSSRAVDFVHPWIQRKTHDSELHALVSSILLTLCGDADWAGEFLHQCADSPDFFVSAMAGMLHDKPFVRENFAVLMQKMSKIPELSRFIRNDTSFYKMLIDLETRVDSSDVTSSDFFFLNLRSILQNLESSQR
ncbi:hypothetical protein DFJ73DRAFT_141664 [Zopfochytrium polystomum]|nr:hypothetical protein DFJ73DRAFT_141664 [Zopfochytrium polystomum]